MLTIQSVMLIALGFFGSFLLALLLAPAYWKRAVRLTTERLKRSLPVDEMEIRADRDRLRADFAMQIFRLEQAVERGRLASARHLVEVSRRDAAKGVLEGQVRKLEATLAEATNARQVLELTVTDRIPQIEQRLSEARDLLSVRNQEIDDLKAIGTQQQRALQEAEDMHAQQLAEIQRLTAQLATAGAANTGATSDDRFDGEVALRSEIEDLRARTREQSGLIERLRATRAPDGEPATDSVAAPSPLRSESESEVERLRQALHKAQLALTDASDGGAGAGKASITIQRALRVARVRLDEQEAELVQLRATLAAYETTDSETASGGIKESKIALRARLAAAEALGQQQSATIAKVQTELTAATERLAQQGEYFAAELKRLGAGTLQAGYDHTPGPPRVEGGHRINLADRVARARGDEAERDAKVVDLLPLAGGQSSSLENDGVSERRESGGPVSRSNASSNGAKRTRLLDRISGLSDS